MTKLNTTTSGDEQPVLSSCSKYFGPSLWIESGAGVRARINSSNYHGQGTSCLLDQMNHEKDDLITAQGLQLNQLDKDIGNTLCEDDQNAEGASREPPREHVANKASENTRSPAGKPAESNSSGTLSLPRKPVVYKPEH